METEQGQSFVESKSHRRKEGVASLSEQTSVLVELALFGERTSLLESIPSVLQLTPVLGLAVQKEFRSLSKAASFFELTSFFGLYSTWRAGFITRVECIMSADSIVRVEFTVKVVFVGGADIRRKIDCHFLLETMDRVRASLLLWY